VTPVRHYFEALNTVDHRTPIPATGLYIHRLLSKFNRLQLASVARYLWDNVGMVFYATDLVANYSTPMVPRAATLNRKWNEAANGFFDDWAERADFTGRFDFWDLQRLASFYLDTDGEVFALWTDEAGAFRRFSSWSPGASTSLRWPMTGSSTASNSTPRAGSRAIGSMARASSTRTHSFTSSTWSGTRSTEA
jgi:hypothetical protein